MKETRFIELLNLYVDQQLTASEAAELEAELQRNSSRRKTYQEYCRMQKGCALLFEQERKAAPSSSKLARALAQADRKVVAFPTQRNEWLPKGLFAGGIAAVAACVAFVFVRQASSPKFDLASHASSPSTPAAVAAAMPTLPASQPQTVTVAVPPADDQLAPASRLAYSILPVRQLVPIKVVAPASDSVAGDDRPDFAWMKKVKMNPMRPVSADELLAGADAPVQPLSEGSYLLNTRPTPANFENAAFQYQKGK